MMVRRVTASFSCIIESFRLFSLFHVRGVYVRTEGSSYLLGLFEEELKQVREFQYCDVFKIITSGFY